MHELWRLLRHRPDFRRLATANLISLTGDWMVAVGLAYFVYQLTGSTLASAGSMLASFLPSILLSSLAGVYVDRWNRRTTLIAANLLMAACVVPLLWVTSPRDVWVIYVVTAAIGTLKLFTIPAEQAMLPRVVEDEELVDANALNGQAREVARLLGSAVGGLVVATGGIAGLAVADAGTFLVAALLVARVATDGSVPAAEPVSGETPARARGLARLVGEWLDGLRLAGSHRGLQAVFAFTALAMTGEGIMGSLFAPFVKDVLGGTARAYGFIVSVQAIGGILGGLVAVHLGRRLSAAAMFGFGAVAFGLVDLVMFLYPLVWVQVWPAAVCMIVVGVPGAVAMVGYNTLLLRSTQDAFRGRVLGALGALQGLAVVLGTLVAGFLGETVGILPIIALQGLLGVIAGLVVLMLLRRQLAR